MATWIYLCFKRQTTQPSTSNNLFQELIWYFANFICYSFPLPLSLSLSLHSPSPSDALPIRNTRSSCSAFQFKSLSVYSSHLNRYIAIWLYDKITIEHCIFRFGKKWLEMKKLNPLRGGRERKIFTVPNQNNVWDKRAIEMKRETVNQDKNRPTNHYTVTKNGVFWCRFRYVHTAICLCACVCAVVISLEMLWWQMIERIQWKKFI